MGVVVGKVGGREQTLTGALKFYSRGAPKIRESPRRLRNARPYPILSIRDAQRQASSCGPTAHVRGQQNTVDDVSINYILKPRNLRKLERYVALSSCLPTITLLCPKAAYACSGFCRIETSPPVSNAASLSVTCWTREPPIPLTPCPMHGVPETALSPS
jgi:hypothetical protein